MITFKPLSKNPGALQVRDNDTAQVTGVTVDAGDARLVVNWTAVDNATGYTVQWKSGNQGYNTGNRQATITSGTTTSHTITGLTNGTAYTVRVSATRTGANDGPPSAGVTKTPEANTSTNTDPLTLTVEAVQDTVTEGAPVRYRIVMSKPTRGVEVEAVYRYRGEFLRHDPSSTLTGIPVASGRPVLGGRAPDAGRRRGRGGRHRRNPRRLGRGLQMPE